jgi:hypothetical protein
MLFPNGVKPITLSNSSNPAIVTLVANTLNVMTPAATFTAPVGSEFYIPAVSENAQGTPKRGTYLVLDLRDAAGVKLPANTLVRISFQNPGKESEENVRTVPHGIWTTLDSAQQRNADFRDRLLDSFVMGEEYPNGIRITEGGLLNLELKSAVAVDWTKSTFEVAAGEGRPVR